MESIVEEIGTLLEDFSTETRGRIKSKILEFQGEDTNQISKFNSLIQKQMRATLRKTMAKGNLEELSKLLEMICEVAQADSGIQGVSSKVNNSLAIIMVEDILESLGINDLKEILPTISERVCSFEKLQQADQNRLLRVINHLLKRISKTEDYLIRGELQFALAKVLPYLHDSGFHYRSNPSSGVVIVEDENEAAFSSFSSEGITSEFYNNFWGLQRYLVNPNELITDSKASAEDLSPGKRRQPGRPDPLMLARLKDMEYTLVDLIKYMKSHPCSHESVSLLSQPIKFLTNTNLLEFQLRDPYFRKIILVQFLVFVFTMKSIKSTSGFLKGFVMTEAERQTLLRIERETEKYLQQLLSHEQSAQSGEQLLQMIRSFLSDEVYWAELKESWKEKKKSFFSKQHSDSSSEEGKRLKSSTEYEKKIEESRQRMSDQMNIESETLLRFLTEKPKAMLTKEPTQVSFSAYWQQSKSCLQGFDYEKGTQYEFETKSEYNLFEWKALRSLYRESIIEICLGEKNPALKDYKALSYVEKKQKQLREKIKSLSQQEPNSSLQGSIDESQESQEKSKLPQAPESSKPAQAQEKNGLEQKPAESAETQVNKDGGQIQAGPTKKIKTD